MHSISLFSEAIETNIDNVDSVTRLESFRALKLTLLEIFMALKLS